MKTLIISSSLSPTSRSFVLCNQVKSKLEEQGVEVEMIDAREMELKPCHTEKSKSMEELSKKVAEVDNFVIGMGIHCYSINDGLKIILDNCFSEATGKFFGIVCAAGGDRSYLSTQHLTQICMNEWRMIQLPRILYATKNDFDDNQNLESEDVMERAQIFADEFVNIGNKLVN